MRQSAPRGLGRPTERRRHRAASPLNLAFVPRGEVQLATSISGDVPEIGLRKGVLEKVPKSEPAPKPK